MLRVRRIPGELRLHVRTLACVLAEQNRSADDGRPESVGAAEQRDQRFAQLLGSERSILKQREFPAVERLAEIGILVGSAEPN